MGNEYAGRHVVVTGGGGALGSAVIAALRDAGAICHVPPREVGLVEEDAVRAYYDTLPELWGSVHCAGGFAMSPIESTSVADLHAMLAGNLRTCFLCCREAVRRIRESAGEGRIVNVAARPALEPRLGAGMVAYTAAKAAVAALTQALAEEVAAEGIWVNAVAPSIIDTPANRAAMPDADHERWPAPEEIAETIVFLASPRNRSTRGTVAPVYGKS